MLEFDNGPMRETLEYFDGRQLCDGVWHSLFVSKDGLTGSVSVDNSPPQSVVSSCDLCQSFVAVNTDGPLYVGGLPGKPSISYIIHDGVYLTSHAQHLSSLATMCRVVPLKAVSATCTFNRRAASANPCPSHKPWSMRMSCLTFVLAYSYYSPCPQK